jgi:predicted alpha/beta superfamily hydrolase
MKLSLTVLLAGVALAGPAPAQTPAATDPSVPAESVVPAASPALLLGAVQFDVTSKITQRTYRIYVAGASAPPSKGGYPVIYVVDAGASFATAASQAGLGRFEGKRPALVVGITYPDARSTLTLRNRDLTPSEPVRASRAQMEKTFGTVKPGDFGGADDFHRFMMEELRPLIARMYEVDARDQSIMGYSFGGLFALHVLFEHPNAYRSFVAGSPSIWWNDCELLKDEASFASAVRAGRASPRILITSDEWEQPKGDPDRMVDNARELATRLEEIKGPAGYDVRYVLFPSETHVTGIPASTSRGVAFISVP